MWCCCADWLTKVIGTNPVYYLAIPQEEYGNYLPHHLLTHLPQFILHALVAGLIARLDFLTIKLDERTVRFFVRGMIWPFLKSAGTLAFSLIVLVTCVIALLHRG